nr:hypothetical protein [Tanacetum cinerariifolium]
MVMIIDLVVSMISGKPAPLSSSNLKVAGSNPRLALGVPATWHSDMFTVHVAAVSPRWQVREAQYEVGSQRLNGQRSMLTVNLPRGGCQSEVACMRYGANGRLTRGQKHVIMRFVIRANDWCRGNDWLAEAQYEVGSPRQ